MENNSLEAGVESGGTGQGERSAGTLAADRWREIVLRQKQSGLGPAAFCRAEGVPQSSFFAWRRKLAGRTKAGKTAKRSAVEFARVKVTTGAVRDVPVPAGRDAIELRLRGRRRLIVRRGFDPELLSQVVRVLEGLGVDGRGVGGVS